MALPLSTSDAVVGFTKAPALTTKAKRPLLNEVSSGDMAVFRPMVWPKCVPESCDNEALLTAMLGRDLV